MQRFKKLINQYSIHKSKILAYIEFDGGNISQKSWNRGHQKAGKVGGTKEKLLPIYNL